MNECQVSKWSIEACCIRVQADISGNDLQSTSVSEWNVRKWRLRPEELVDKEVFCYNLVNHTQPKDCHRPHVSLWLGGVKPASCFEAGITTHSQSHSPQAYACMLSKAVQLSPRVLRLIEVPRPLKAFDFPVHAETNFEIVVDVPQVKRVTASLQREPLPGFVSVVRAMLCFCEKLCVLREVMIPKEKKKNCIQVKTTFVKDRLRRLKMPQSSNS